MSAGIASPRSGRVAELVDRVVCGPALVAGSLPPHGHDLDLLLRAEEQRALAAALAEQGFACQVVQPFEGYPEGMRVWAHFHDCDADVLDTIPVGNFELPAEEVERLFAESRPIPGFSRLVRPAPHDVLLILAHDLPYHRARPLSPSRRARLERALAEDPRAWERARALAPGWRVEQELAELADAARSAPAGAGPVPTRRGPLETLRAYRRAWLRGRLIAFSGPDPGERRAQAEGLVRALDALHIPARLEQVAAGRALPAALRAMAVGDVVVCDGYALDASVRLRSRVAGALVRLLNPRPLRAYLVDSPAPPAGRYRELAPAFGARPLDASRAREELCAEVALDVWQAVR